MDDEIDEAAERQRRREEQKAADKELKRQIRVMFGDQSVHQNFAQKVYGTLFIQLLVTFGIMLFFRLHESTHSFLNGPNAAAFWWTCLGVTICFIVLVFFIKVRHSHRVSFILFTLFTIIEGVLLGGLTCITSTEIFLIAVEMLAISCGAIYMFVCLNWMTYTPHKAISSIIAVLLITTLIQQFLVESHRMQMLYAALGALGFVLYLILNMQLLIGGYYPHTIIPDEHILATFELYLGISIFSVIYYFFKSKN